MKKLLMALLIGLPLLPLMAAEVQVTVVLGEAEAPSRELAVTLEIPPGQYVYADMTEVTVSAGALTLRSRPDPVVRYDATLEKDTASYAGNTLLRYGWDPQGAVEATVAVSYQACTDTLCFLPVTREFPLVTGAAASSLTGTVVATPAALEGGELPLVARVKRYRLAAKDGGYMDVGNFIRFLEQSQSGAAVPAVSWEQQLGERGLWLTLLIIVLGGLGLNLTPCVLPLIPVNLAIIGAGVQAGSKRRGFLLGGAYGLGIAVAYGALGLAVVLTGSRFGQINASPWFNVAIALLFLVLALGMFDVIHIDLSRFQTRVGDSPRRGRPAGAFLLGAVAALLAGACVAPVVIWVLVLATNLYAGGQTAGLLLPFLLGIGMGLPWPFAGAGMSFLPKPGRWMERVKLGFGVVILIFAAYYGWMAYKLARPVVAVPVVVEGGSDGAAAGLWLTSLEAALDQAESTGRPVFIDFWASWCKSCLHMDRTTFKDPEALSKLAAFIPVKYRAEDLSEPEADALLRHFEAIGLPLYVVLYPPARP